MIVMSTSYEMQLTEFNYNNAGNEKSKIYKPAGNERMVTFPISSTGITHIYI